MSNETEPEFDPFAEPTKKGNGSGSAAVAWLALLLALVLAAYTGWDWWQERRAADDDATRLALDDLRARQASLAERQRDQSEAIAALSGLELEAALEELETRYGQTASVSGAHRQRLEAAEQALEETHARLESTEEALAALAVRGESPTRRLELAEVEYLLRTANERLQLFGDLATADRALALADEVLLSIDDPLYLPVRRAIAAARLALDSAPANDVVGLVETLARAQREIPALPFAGERDAARARDAGDSASDADGEAPGIWQRFKNTLAALVTVRRRTDDEGLISIGDREYVRQGLWLQLETARLALMRGDGDLYGAALDRAEETLDRYFEGSSSAVSAWRERLARLRSARFEVVYPDISGPWARLQRLREPAPAAAPAAEELAPADTPPAEPGAAGESAAGESETGPEPGSEAEPESEPEPEPEPEPETGEEDAAGDGDDAG